MTRTDSTKVIPIVQQSRFPIGTQSDGKRLPPRHGRYKVVGANGKNYLYVPEIQQLYSVSQVLGHVLRGAETNPVKVSQGAPISSLSQGAHDLVSFVVKRDGGEQLSESRHAHMTLRDVVVHVSQRCNLNCVYCYATELNKINKVMTHDMANKVIAHTMMMSADQGLASVKFLGGEPTLAWPIIEHMMREYDNASRDAGKPQPRYTMVTNGTKMNAAMIRSAAEHQMHVLVSVDGPADIHDQLRPTLGGKGSYVKAVATLKALVAAGVNVAVESVYTKQHFLQGVTPQIMVDHFLSLGVREMQIAPAVGIWHGADTIEQTNNIAELFADAARNSVQSFRTDHPYVLRGIQFVLDGFSLKERRRHVCGAGRTFMGINYDGEAFPCYLLESDNTSYGFIDRQWNQQRYENIRSKFVQNGKDNHPVCRECWANEICQSCLGTSWQISPEVTKPPAWFCGFQKTIIGAVLAEIADVRGSDEWTTFLANMQRYLAPLTSEYSYA